MGQRLAARLNRCRKSKSARGHLNLGEGPPPGRIGSAQAVKSEALMAARAAHPRPVMGWPRSRTPADAVLTRHTDSVRAAERAKAWSVARPTDATRRGG